MYFDNRHATSSLPTAHCNKDSLLLLLLPLLLLPLTKTSIWMAGGPEGGPGKLNSWAESIAQPPEHTGASLDAA